jgi:hypothetical protein
MLPLLMDLGLSAEERASQIEQVVAWHNDESDPTLSKSDSGCQHYYTAFAGPVFCRHQSRID